MKSIKKANLKGKRVILRTDFNVPLKNGKVSDDSRIKEALPTIEYILNQGSSVVIISHLGRPEGKRVGAMSLRPVATRLGKLLGKRVEFLNETTGLKAREKANRLKPGQVLCLENLRFSAQEELGDSEFAKKLAELGNIFVQEAFSCAHRNHASMVGVPSFLPSYAGLHFEEEYTKLSEIFKNPKKPFVIVAGGKKTETKVGLLEKMIGKADIILLGGGLSNTFLAAESYEIGKSFYEETYVSDAERVLREAYDKGTEILMPSDVLTAKNVTETARTEEKDVEQIGPNDIIVDIGPKTISKYAQPIKFAGTIFWNGPMGISENKNFESGTKAIANMVSGGDMVSVLGGGDTLAAMRSLKISEDGFTYISSSGGALMKLLSGDKMPAVDALK